MYIYLSDLQASEDINNNSICVIENNKVRSMNKLHDIEGDTVYVNNFMPIGSKDNIIRVDEYVRCVRVNIMPNSTY